MRAAEVPVYIRFSNYILKLNILEEPFNENFTRWDPNNKNYRDLIHDIPSLEAQLADDLATYNGIKVLDYQLPDDLNVHLLQRPNHKIIFLRRINVLQSVVSVLIAKQTQLWKSGKRPNLWRSIIVTSSRWDVYEIQQRVTALKQHLDYLESVIDCLARDKAIKLTYEALYFASPTARDAQIHAIWDFWELHR